MSFPYGKAPLALLIVALCTSTLQVWLHVAQADRERADLTMVTFSKQHALAYREPIRRFEQERGVRIVVQVVDGRALQGRLQSAFQIGAEVPDIVELLDGMMGCFTKGPLENVGFVDLTDRINTPGLVPGLPDESLHDAVVTSRFSKWSSRGRIFAMPHDLHPVMLAYRRDLVEELGIDVTKLTTWDKFAAVGREVTKDLDGDGVPDRYMLDLPIADTTVIRTLLLQRGGRILDEHEQVAFDNAITRDVVVWYVQQVEGRNRIAFPSGGGQNFARSVIDGLCLFYVSPDWRTKMFELDTPSMAGKMAVMPLPAWEEDGRRTSTWGGTGLAITKQCADRGRFDLAWDLAMYLYYDAHYLGPRFAQSNILPPLIAAWEEPEFDQPSAFFSGMKLGREFAAVGTQVPQEQSSAYMSIAESKLNEAYANALLYFRSHGLDGLAEYTDAQLHEKAAQVRRVMDRNVFLVQPEASAP